MPQNVPEELSRTIETLYRAESGRILATLVRLLGDLDIAEEAMHEAFAAAFDTWPQAGIVAPILSGWLLQVSGSYAAPMQVIFVFLLIGALATVFLLRPEWAPKPRTGSPA